MVLLHRNNRRFALIPILVLVLVCVPATLPGRAQEAGYGPVVNGYLLGLAEELGELEFLVRRGEISQQAFARARGRLLVVRRYVVRAANERGEDRVPALQVLAADELKALGLGAAPHADELRVGSTFGERWKLVAVEDANAREAQPRFYVFEGIKAPVRSSTIDPQSVIETVVIEEKSFKPPPPNPSPPNPSPLDPAAPVVEAGAEAPKTAAPSAPALDGPRIITFYLPTYSREARAKGVEGEVVVSALFRRDGKIREIVVAQSLGHGLDERAREAVRRIEFEPARQGGQTVDARTLIAFQFKLIRVTVRMRGAAPVDADQTTRK